MQPQNKENVFSLSSSVSSAGNVWVLFPFRPWLSALCAMLCVVSASAVFSSNPLQEKKRLDPSQQVPVKPVHLQKLFESLKVAIVLPVLDDLLGKLGRD